MLLNDIELRYFSDLSFLYDKREVSNIFFEILNDKFSWSRCEIGDRQGEGISAEIEQYLMQVLEALKQAKPLQYILNKAYFYDYPFYVDERVLIPRPETEELVYWVIQDFKGKEGRGLDIGSGSGCIPISLDLNLDKVQMTSIDVSKGAIEVSELNNEKLNANVQFKCLNAFSDQLVSDLSDLSFIVSNPPYIAEKERDVMKDNVLKYEPELALFAEGDALGFYKRIATVGRQILKDQGALYFECNEFNAKRVVEILTTFGYESIELRKDLQSKDRMVKAIFKK